jgi:hypothetical protein
MGKCGGGRYKRRVSGYGRVIVCRVVCPFFFKCVYERLLTFNVRAFNCLESPAGRNFLGI